jgi:hypothetical protein
VTYSQIPWLPLAGGLALLGFIGSWFAWRRRGPAAGLRGVAWSLLPVAAYLTKTIRVLWQVGSAIGSWVTSFVFSFQVWLGVAVAGASAVLFVASGWLRGRKAGKGIQTQSTATSLGTGAATSVARSPRGPSPITAGRDKPAGGTASGDDDLADIQEILRRRGIH